MMEVTKAYRVISIEGCEVIGSGANGEVYRIDRDTIVKVYNNPDSLPEIHKERELARTAFISGVPTAIPYDVVKIEGGGYGSVFELLNAKCFVDLLVKEHRPLDEVVAMSVDLLKTIHSSTVDPDIMPSMKEVALRWADSSKGILPDEEQEKLKKMLEAVPEDNHMIHGDYHLKNIMLQNGESLLIDMDTLCHGNPIFEFAGMFFTYVAFDEIDPANTERFLGIPYETTGAFWDKAFRLYLEGMDEETIQAAMKKAKVIGYTHLIAHTVTRGGQNTEQGKKKIDLCTKRLSELLPEVDSLTW
jgi:uncharacterized protein (TIGR02172 family)